MKPEETGESPQPLSRREFIKTSAVTAAALASTGLTGAYAAGSDKIRVGLVGCGGRGTGAATDCITSSSNVELVAMGDLFKDRLDDSRGYMKQLGERNKVTDGTCFTGFDAYQKVINSDIDLVILATPPGFRPMHLRAAIEAGKNVFMEKPVAVDPAGVRSIIESSEMAKKKKLAIVAGTQRRHQKSYLETMKRIHDGAIGEIVSAQCYWNQGGLWNHGRQSGWSDAEWQIRNWLYFAWLSGDHIVEQHVHNLDVINWAFNGHPVSCVGMGGRQARTDPAYGHIYDHFTIDYTYPNGVHVMSMCRQIDGTASNVSEHLVGTLGTSNPDGLIQGKNAWRHERGRGERPYVQEHADLIASIRAGQPLNEGIRIAESTLTAVMGRMSAYTGQEVTWEQAMGSKLDLMPKQLALGPLPVDPVAIPGRTRLV
jgi:myo-inositol 2-dehydrogenase / D-chiro-inositol 1-dehydrogenase